MRSDLPDLSRFEWECLKQLWTLSQGSVRDIHDALTNPPSYSTVRKIVERLEQKGAIERVERADKAWVYRPAVGRAAMLRKEVRRFLDTVFDGSAAPLVAQLAEMDALSLAEIRKIEEQIGSPGRPRATTRRKAPRRS